MNGSLHGRSGLPLSAIEELIYPVTGSVEAGWEDQHVWIPRDGLVEKFNGTLTNMLLAAIGILTFCLRIASPLYGRCVEPDRLPRLLRYGHKAQYDKKATPPKMGNRVRKIVEIG